MADPVCPETGAPMHRGVRPMTISYKGASATFDMPGWYCDVSDESIHTGEDMRVSDRALNRLRAQTQGLPLPEEIKRIRAKLGLTREAAGALIGGLGVGVVESVSGLYFGDSLGQLGVYLIFILVLLVRPTGLFGATA